MHSLWIIYGSGWWLSPTPSEKNEFVNWDYYSSIWNNKIHVPNHQPAMYIYIYHMNQPPKWMVFLLNMIISVGHSHI